MYVILQPSLEVIAAVSAYKTALGRLNKNHPTVSASETRCQEAYERLMSLLRSERFSAPVDRIFESQMSFDPLAGTDDIDFLNVETAILNQIQGVGKVEARSIIFKVYDHLRLNSAGPPNSMEMLTSQVALYHHNFMEKFRKSREQQRKEKKRQRRELVTSAGYFCSGLSIFAANAFAIIPAPFVTPSIGLGGGAMLKGFWDIERII